MPEFIHSDYRTLFEVRLLHHYWLDEGATVFDAIGDSQVRVARLLRHDCRQFLEVGPTAQTADLLAGLGGVFRPTGLGFVVGVPADAQLATDQNLEFQVAVSDGRFFNYTALTLRRPVITELSAGPDVPPWRFKSGVPVLSNLSGGTRTLNGEKVLFLSREIPAPAADDAAECIVLSGGKVRELTSDGPGAATAVLAATPAAAPLYVHQGDVPPIVPPPGLAGVPDKGIQLTGGMRDDILLLIRVTGTRGDDASFSCVDAAGRPLPVPPVYQVRLRNRRSVWTYLDRNTGAPVSIEPGPLPLTHFGNAGPRQKAGTDAVSAQMVGAAVQRIVSEVYV